MMSPPEPIQLEAGLPWDDVAPSVSRGSIDAQVDDLLGERCGDRTHDLLIKSLRCRPSRWFQSIAFVGKVPGTPAFWLTTHSVCLPSFSQNVVPRWFQHAETHHRLRHPSGHPGVQGGRTIGAAA